MSREAQRLQLGGIEVERKDAAGGGARERGQTPDAARRVQRRWGRLGEHGQHLVALPHREVHALAQLTHELAQDRRRRRHELRFSDARRNGEQAPAEPVRERLPVALDEAVLLERPERPRELALVTADELCQRDNPHARPGGRLLGQRTQSREAPLESGRARIHARTLIGSPSSTARRSTYSTSSSSIASSSGGAS